MTKEEMQAVGVSHTPDLDERRTGMLTAKVSSKGQIVIPSEIRKAINVGEGDSITLELLGDGKVIMQAVHMKPLKSLRGALAPKDGVGAELDYKEIRNEAWKAVTEKKFSGEDK